jgi:hypothetical protein
MKAYSGWGRKDIDSPTGTRQTTYNVVRLTVTHLGRHCLAAVDATANSMHDGYQTEESVDRDTTG